MVSDDKRWETIAAQITFHQTKTRDAFDFFVKIATAVVGGSAWLSVQDNVGDKAGKLAVVGNLLLVFAALLTAFIISEHHNAWRRWRVAQSGLLGNNDTGNPIIPLPAKRSAGVDLAMAISAIIFSLVFCVLNPLS